jgi:hypothetical protein
MGRWLTAAVLLCGSACNASPDCQSAGNALCARGAACAADGSVSLVGAVNVTFSSEGQCNAFYTLSCANDAGSIDYAACTQAASSALCDAGSAVLPSSCVTPQ